MFGDGADVSYELEMMCVLWRFIYEYECDRVVFFVNLITTKRKPSYR